VIRPLLVALALVVVALVIAAVLTWR